MEALQPLLEQLPSSTATSQSQLHSTRKQQQQPLGLLDPSAPTSPGARVKAAIAVKIWSQLLLSDAKKEELLKLGGVIKLLVLIEDAATDAEAAYAAAGCLASLAAHPKCLQDMAAAAPAASRVVSCCLGLLTGGHDRSKLPASQVLLLMAQQPQLVPRLAAAQPVLLDVLSGSGCPAWAGGRQVAAAAAGVLQALLEPSEYEPETIKQARRSACLSSGVVRALLDQLLGAASPLLLSAAACLRFIALAPAAADVLAGDAEVASRMLQLLGRGGTPGVAAYLCGTLWELAAAPAAAAQLVEAGAVPILMGVVHENAPIAAVKAKRAKAMKADQSASSTAAAGKPGNSPGSKVVKPAAAAAAAAGGAGDAGGSVKGLLMTDPQAAAELALCNAAGALHHLSFLDEAKQQLALSPHLPLLVKLLGASSGQLYDNVVGALWNAALLPANQPLLAAAGAPSHLAKPLPARWTTANTVSIPGKFNPAAPPAGIVAGSPTGGQAVVGTPTGGTPRVASWKWA